jgi:catechol 2,3-dioxygenase-like lactoylglutathione lyase family enzyme
LAEGRFCLPWRCSPPVEEEGGFAASAISSCLRAFARATPGFILRASAPPRETTRSDTMSLADSPPVLGGIHHVAYRCKDAKDTVEFYRDVLGMEFKLAIAEDKVPSTGADDPYMHVFLDAGGGNVLAFFELPNQPEMGRDEKTPAWVQHIAFKVADYDSLLTAKARAEARGLQVIGPTHHGVFKSIYFFDPNGHRLELAWDFGTEDQMQRLKDVAEDMLEEWSRTRKAPRHAAWLHEKIAQESAA